MKKLISLIAIFALVLSISAVAFAAPSGGSSDYSVVVNDADATAAGVGNKGQNVNVPMVTGLEIGSAVVNGEKISKDFPSDLHFDKINNAPENLKASALKYVAAIINQGLEIDNGFCGWSDSGTVTSCEIKFDLKDGQKVFVDGVVVDVPADGFITVDIPVTVIIAH